MADYASYIAAAVNLASRFIHSDQDPIDDIKAALQNGVRLEDISDDSWAEAGLPAGGGEFARLWRLQTNQASASDYGPQTDDTEGTVSGITTPVEHGIVSSETNLPLLIALGIGAYILLSD